MFRPDLPVSPKICRYCAAHVAQFPSPIDGRAEKRDTEGCTKWSASGVEESDRYVQQHDQPDGKDEVQIVNDQAQGARCQITGFLEPVQQFHRIVGRDGAEDQVSHQQPPTTTGHEDAFEANPTEHEANKRGDYAVALEPPFLPPRARGKRASAQRLLSHVADSGIHYSAKRSIGTGHAGHGAKDSTEHVICSGVPGQRL